MRKSDILFANPAISFGARMPVFNNTEFRVDFDGLSRDVVTLGLKMVTRGFETGFHSHRKAQCVMAVSGVLTCEAEGGIWLVPPQTAIWIPPGVEHCITFAGNVEGYNAFVEPAAARDLPSKCCSIAATPLLRELLIRTAQYPTELAEGGMESRVAALLLEEISISEAGQLHRAWRGFASRAVEARHRMMFRDHSDPGNDLQGHSRKSLIHRRLPRHYYL